MQLESTELISAISLFVAFLAVLLSAWVSYQQLRHNRLSVRPVANIVADNYRNRVCVALKNGGTGPLIVKQLEIRHADGRSPVLNNLTSVLPPLPDGVRWDTFYELMEGEPLSPQASWTLLELHLDTESFETERILNAVREELKQLKMTLEYTDIYGETFTLKRDLSWYGYAPCVAEWKA